MQNALGKAEERKAIVASEGANLETRQRRLRTEVANSHGGYLEELEQIAFAQAEHIGTHIDDALGIVAIAPANWETFGSYLCIIYLMFIFATYHIVELIFILLFLA